MTIDDFEQMQKMPYEEYLLTPNAEKQTFIHAIMTGDMGAQGKFQHSEKIKLNDKWIKLFGGNYADQRPDLKINPAPKFKVSSKCCYYMKETPCDEWAKEHNSLPYLGLMATEGGQREMALKKNGWGRVLDYIGVGWEDEVFDFKNNQIGFADIGEKYERHTTHKMPRYL